MNAEGGLVVLLYWAMAGAGLVVGGSVGLLIMGRFLRRAGILR